MSGLKSTDLAFLTVHQNLAFSKNFHISKLQRGRDGEGCVLHASCLGLLRRQEGFAATLGIGPLRNKSNILRPKLLDHFS
jgi:hypothetical protein